MHKGRREKGVCASRHQRGATSARRIGLQPWARGVAALGTEGCSLGHVWLQPWARRVAARLEQAHQREVLAGPRRALETHAAMHAAALALALAAARGVRGAPPRLRRCRRAVGRLRQQTDRATLVRVSVGG